MTNSLKEVNNILLKNKNTILLILIATFLLQSCSVKRDTFLNRSYHSVTAKYNILYNGNLAFEEGLKQINENHTDNFWQVLPIEPLKTETSAFSEEKEEENGAFDKAEEKAVKAIQRHSMIIGRKQRNKQIDDAYLLLGKSRYYSKRFVPALEAFDFVIENHSKSNVHNLAKVWRAKTLVRLNNEEQAVTELKKLLEKQPNLPVTIKEKVHTTIALAYTNLDSISKVVEYLKLATTTQKNKKQTARNLYILGQLYQKENHKDSSNIAFGKILKLKRIPYKYKVYSNIERIKNTKENREDKLKKLIKNIDNKPYLSTIYYYLGKAQKDSLLLALNSYKKSIQTNTKTNYQKELSYEALADIYFDKSNFVTAGAYYDSILQITQTPNTKRIRKVARKSKNLAQVIELETLVKENDSILTLVAMPKEKQKQFFQNYIEKRKKEKEKIAKKTTKKKSTGSFFVSDKNKYDGKSGKWYFYNNQAVNFGKQTFKQVWGNRPLEDNWRLSNKTIIKEVKSTTLENKISKVKEYDVEDYMNRIPNKKEEIDSLNTKRNIAYYKLGVIYKEQFNEPHLAIKRLEKVLTHNPSESIKIPAKYNLYKLYEKANHPKAIAYKEDIVKNYPESNYAKYIINPQLLSSENERNINANYALAFKLYEEEKYEETIAKAKLLIAKYQSHPIVAKLNLLKAYAIGKTKNAEEFKKALEFVVLNYPNTEEANKATEIIKIINNHK